MLRAKRALHTKDTQVDMGHSMPTQPILRKVPWAPSQIFLKTAPNVPVWEQWKIPKFQTKYPSGLDFMAFWTARATTYFCPRGSTMLILKGFWKPITSLLYKLFVWKLVLQIFLACSFLLCSQNWARRFGSKVISISKLEFCQAEYIFVTFWSPAMRSALGQDLNIHLVYDI